MSKATESARRALKRATEAANKARERLADKIEGKPQAPKGTTKRAPVSRSSRTQLKTGNRKLVTKAGVKLGGRALGVAGAFAPAAMAGVKDLKKAAADEREGIVPIDRYPEALKQHRANTAAFNTERAQQRETRRAELGIEFKDGEGSISREAMAQIKRPLTGRKAPIMPVASTQTGWRNPVSAPVEQEPAVAPKTLRAGLVRDEAGVMRDETGATYFGDDYLGNIKSKDLRQGIATDLYGRGLLEDPAQDARIAEMAPGEIEKQVAARKQVNTDRNTRTAQTVNALQRTDPKLASKLMKSQAKAAEKQKKRMDDKLKAADTAVQSLRDNEYKVATAAGKPARAAAAGADTMATQYAPVLARDPSTTMQASINRIERMRDKVAEAAGDARNPYLHDWLFGWTSFKDPANVSDPGQTGAVFGAIAKGLAAYKNNPDNDTFMLGENSIDAETMIEDLDEAGVEVNELLGLGGIRRNMNGKYAAPTDWGGGSLYDFMADMHAR